MGENLQGGVLCPQKGNQRCQVQRAADALPAQQPFLLLSVAPWLSFEELVSPTGSDSGGYSDPGVNIEGPLSNQRP